MIGDTSDNSKFSISQTVIINTSKKSIKTIPRKKSFFKIISYRSLFSIPVTITVANNGFNVVRQWYKSLLHQTYNANDVISLPPSWTRLFLTWQILSTYTLASTASLIKSASDQSSPSTNTIRYEYAVIYHI